MVAYVITGDCNIDQLGTLSPSGSASARAGGDTIDTNGFNFTIDQDCRYGLTGIAGGSFGSMTINASKGGNIEIDARYVRLIPYNTGSGNVPAYNTTISQGSASGKLIAVYSAVNATPTAVGAAMPASGFIKVKAWNSVAYAAGALTGIGATATGADKVGFIEVVGDEAATVNANRLGIFRMRGDWYDIGTTDGNRATTYQMPTNGSLQWLPALEVETSAGSGVYEVYVNAGSRTALAANIATDAVRGKVFWMSTAGVIRFGHDGTNSTGGFCPATGLKIRMSNIITQNCTTAARTANVLPNSTLATRYDFTTTGGGQIVIDKAILNWYPSVSQAYSCSMSHVGVMSSLNLNEISQPMTTMEYIGVGQEAATTFSPFLLTLCFAGGTFSNCVWSRAALATAVFVEGLTDISGFTFNSCKSFSFTARGNAGAGNNSITRAANCTWNNQIVGTGMVQLTTCSSLNFNNTVYFDDLATTTPTANPMYLYSILSGSTDIKCDGVTFAGALMQPYSGIMNIGAAGCKRIKLRNLGTAASPLDMGGAYVNATWTRATTTMTVTKTAHGLKANDLIAVNIVSDTAPKAVTTTTATLWTVATAPTADTFTVTVTNAGAASGTLSYYPTMAGVLLNLVAGAAANDVKIQRCYTPHLRTGLMSGDNSHKNLTFENVWGTDWGVQLIPELNAFTKGIQSTPALTAQTACYGTHFADYFTTGTPADLAGVSWTRSTTTATVTSNNHGLRTGNVIDVSLSSSTAAIVLGQKTITVLTENTFTFTCLNAGSASGTLTMSVLNARIAIQMNEATSDTTNQYTIDSGTPAFTAAGGLYMPVIGQQVTFETPYYILGHTDFKPLVPVMAGGTIANYGITYAINKNDGNGYSSFKNLYYGRTGGGGSNGSTTITMTSTTGVAAGDYVTGTNVGIRAKVVTVDSSTNITVDVANTGTVSGTLIFFQHPSETGIDASLGFKLKVRIKTITTNTTAITSLYVNTGSTAVSRAYQYPLDLVPLTITVKDVNTGAVIPNARIFLEADSGGPMAAGDDILTGLTDGSGVLTGVTAYFGNQPIVGKVRRASGGYGTLYKSSPVSATIGASGLSLTVLMIPD